MAATESKENNSVLNVTTAKDALTGLCSYYLFHKKKIKAAKEEPYRTLTKSENCEERGGSGLIFLRARQERNTRSTMAATQGGCPAIKFSISIESGL